MTTTDRRWSEATRGMVASHISDRAPHDAAGDILAALADARLLADPQELERLRARVAELEQPDPLIAHLVTTAHQWHAAYEAETSPTALADSPAYRQARVALSDAVYRLINAGRLPEHQCGPLSATPPEPAAALGDLGVTCR